MSSLSDAIDAGYALATTCLGGPLTLRLEAASAAKFAWIEFFWQDIAESGMRPAQIRRLCDDLGLKCHALQPIRGFEGEGPRETDALLGAARRFMDTAAELGVAVVGVCASERDTASGPEGAATMLAKLSGMARPYGLMVGYEALSWSVRNHHLRDAWDAVRLADAGNLGVIIDSFHICARGSDPQLISTIPAAKIAALQLSSTHAPVDMPLIEVSRHHRCFPDEGRMDVGDVLHRTLTAGYRGPITLEMFNDAYRSDDPFAVAAAGYRSLQRLCNGQRKAALAL